MSQDTRRLHFQICKNLTVITVAKKIDEINTMVYFSCKLKTQCKSALCITKYGKRPNNFKEDYDNKDNARYCEIVKAYCTNGYPETCVSCK